MDKYELWEQLGTLKPLIDLLWDPISDFWNVEMFGQSGGLFFSKSQENPKKTVSASQSFNAQSAVCPPKSNKVILSCLLSFLSLPWPLLFLKEIV